MKKPIREMHKKIREGMEDANVAAVLELLQDAKNRDVLSVELSSRDRGVVLSCIDDAINILSATLLQTRVIKKMIDNRYGIK